MKGLISVIVSTYNWPQALNLSLKSLSEQTDLHFEVVVADDGSTEETKEVIEFWRAKSTFPVIHSWQEDLGFRLARSRNLAVSRSHGDYFIFLDGDCLVRSDFVASHRRLAASHYVLAGQRILLSESFTKQCTISQEIGWRESILELIKLSQQKHINRFFPAINLPLGWLRIMRGRKWQLLRGCNWSLFRSDYLEVKGQDEAFEGWGYEDSDMVIRLINNQCRVKWAGFASPCFHLWHKNADRTMSDENLRRLNLIRSEQRVLPKRSLFDAS